MGSILTSIFILLSVPRAKSKTKKNLSGIKKKDSLKKVDLILVSFINLPAKEQTKITIINIGWIRPVMFMQGDHCEFKNCVVYMMSPYATKAKTKQKMGKQRWGCLEDIQWKRNTLTYTKRLSLLFCLLALVFPEWNKMIYFLIKEIWALAACTQISFLNTSTTSVVPKDQVHSHYKTA